MPPRPTPAGDIPATWLARKALTQVSKQGRVQAVVSTHRISRESAHTQGRRGKVESKRDDDDNDDNKDKDKDNDKGPNSGPSNPGPSNSDSSNSSPSPPNSGSSNSSFPPNFGCITCAVRDNDARLLYNGQWSLNGNPAFTTHSTNVPGSSVSFKFNGSGIVVFGTVPQSNSTTPPPTASYVLDAAQPFVTTEPTANRNIPSQPLFAAFELSPEEHSITISIQKAESPYILERIFVFPRVNITQKAVDTGPPEATPSFGPATPVPKAPKTTVDSQTTVRILAGILGSLIVLIIITGLYFLFNRRRRRKASMMLKATPSLSSCGLRDTTIFTSTESIIRNNPSFMWSNYTRSEGGRGSVVDHYLSRPSPPPMPSPSILPPPLPPKL